MTAQFLRTEQSAIQRQRKKRHDIFPTPYIRKSSKGSKYDNMIRSITKTVKFSQGIPFSTPPTIKKRKTGKHWMDKDLDHVSNSILLPTKPRRFAGDPDRQTNDSKTRISKFSRITKMRQNANHSNSIAVIQHTRKRRNIKGRSSLVVSNEILGFLVFASLPSLSLWGRIQVGALVRHRSSNDVSHTD